MSQITNFIVNVIDLLDPLLESNKDLFEAFAYCILDRLGHILFLNTFGLNLSSLEVGSF